MLRLEEISPSQEWTPRSDIVASFDGPFKWCRIPGPTRLVRLLTLGGSAPEGQDYEPNNIEGMFWFDEMDFMAIKRKALADLQKQSAGSNVDPAVIQSRLSMYLRHELRFALAVRRDWTPSFDRYARLSIPRDGSVVALVGKVREQPFYSPDFIGEGEAKNLAAMKLGLPGGLTQVVINFGLSENTPARHWIQSGLIL